MKRKCGLLQASAIRATGAYQRRLKVAAAVLAAATSLALSVGSEAAVLYWDGGDADGSNGAQGGSGTWNSSNLNWYNGTTDVAFVSNDSAIFGGTGGAVTIASGFNLSGLTFTSGGYTLSTSGNLDFTFNANANISAAGATGITVGGLRRIVLNTATFTDTSGIAFNAPVLFNGNGKTLTVNGTSSNATTFATFLGTQSANNGVVNNAINGTGNVSINQLGAAGNFGTPVVLNGTNQETLTYSGSGVLTINGNNTTFSNASGTNSVIFKVSSGTVALGNDNALGYLNASNAATQTTLELNGGTIQASGGARAIANLVTVTNNSTIAGANNLVLSGAVTNSGGNRSLALNNSAATTLAGSVFLSENATTGRTLTLGGSGNASLSGVVADFNGSGAAGGLSYNGTGTLTLGNSNTYTGITTIGGGTVSAASLQNGGATSSIGASSSLAGNLVFGGGGKLLYTGATITIDRNFSVSTGGGGIEVANANTSLSLVGGALGGNTFIKSGPGAVILTGTVVGSGGAAVGVSGGTLELQGSADNSFLGASVTNGTLVLNKVSTNSVHALGGSTSIGDNGLVQLSGSGGDQIFFQANVALTTSTALLDMNGRSEGFNSLTGVAGSKITNSTSTTSVLNVGNNNGASNFGGTIEDGSGGGKVSLTVGGSGATTLSGINVYSGNTSIDGVGNLTLADNAGLKFVIGADGANNQIAGTGTVNLDGDLTLDLADAGTTLGNSWQLVRNDTLTETYGSTFQVLGFAENANVWSYTSTGGVTYEFSEMSGTLSVTAVPEPGTIGLASLAAAGLLMRRRSRQVAHR